MPLATYPDPGRPELAQPPQLNEFAESRVLAEPGELPQNLGDASGQSRAGRDVPVAIGVGLALGAVLVASLWFYRPCFLALLIIAVGVGIYEMSRAVASHTAHLPWIPLILGGTAMQLAAWFRGGDGLIGALLLTVLGMFVWRLADGATSYGRDISYATLLAWYVPFLAGFAALMAQPADGRYRVIIFVLAVVCSDTGGFVVGSLFGRHRMSPAISPKKSWEGFIGSLVIAAGASAAMMVLHFHHLWWQGALFGIAIAVTATIGDLGESMMKRTLGIKDMGHLLPGHGGVMDRLDSLLPSAAVAYLLLSAML